MAARVVYKAAAEAEIASIFKAYEAERQELGIDFFDELVRVEGHLRANPARSTSGSMMICGVPSCDVFGIGSKRT